MVIEKGIISMPVNHLAASARVKDIVFGGGQLKRFSFARLYK